MTGTTSAAQATSPEPSNRPSGLKTLGIAIAVVAWMAVPVIVLMFTPFAQGAGAAASSMIAVGLATLLGGRRWGALLAVWSVIAIGISPVGFAYPAVGTLFIVCRDGRRNLHRRSSRAGHHQSERARHTCADLRHPCRVTNTRICAVLAIRTAADTCDGVPGFRRSSHRCHCSDAVGLHVDRNRAGSSGNGVQPNLHLSVDPAVRGTRRKGTHSSRRRSPISAEPT